MDAAPASPPVEAQTQPRSVPRKPVAPKTQAVTHLCPQCGTGIEALPIGSPNPSEAGFTDAPRDEAAIQKQRKIDELQQEVDRLAGKASAATDRLADYEDEIRALRAQTQPSHASSLLSPGTATPPRPHTADEARQTPSGLATLPETEPLSASNSPITSSPPQQLVPQSALKRATSMRLSYFLTRKTSAQSEPSTPENGPVDPHAALRTERMQRIEAESKLTQVNTEIEDLSATLFQQANEMVAKERRERAEAEARTEKRSAEQSQQLSEQGAQIRKLQERIQILEERDRERAKRLEKLEKGMQRVGRVRGLLVGAQEQRRAG